MNQLKRKYDQMINKEQRTTSEIDERQYKILKKERTTWDCTFCKRNMNIENKQKHIDQGCWKGYGGYPRKCSKCNRLIPVIKDQESMKKHRLSACDTGYIDIKRVREILNNLQKDNKLSEWKIHF